MPRNRPDFRERLEQGVILRDGAMGTYLHRLGVPLDRCFPEQCLVAPERVEQVHRAYVAAGAEIITTNSYGANRLQLERFGLAGQVRKINVHACRLARQAAEGTVWVAGSVGPLGKPMEPLGSISRELAGEVFREQIEALAEAGAEVIFIETISDLDEFDVALAAARAVCDLPVVIHKTFTEDGRTLMGELPHEVVERAEEGGADVVGANCTVGPQRMLDIIERMAQRSKIPLSALPTAGLPRLVEGRVDYHAEPSYMARYTRLLAEAGATIVGACCGSTPEHVAAMAAELAREPVRVSRRSIAVEIDHDLAREPLPVAQRSSLGRRLGEGFVAAVELDLPRSHELDSTVARARVLRDAGVGTVVLSDALRARLFVHPMVAAYRIERAVGLDCVLAYATRDKNVLGIQSDLLAAHVLGVHNILVSSGDPANFGDYPTATTLADLSPTGMVRILDSMNRGLDLAGNPIGEPTRFIAAVKVNPSARDRGAELARIEALVEAGATMVFTEPVFSLNDARALAEPMAACGAHVIVGVLPLRSAAHAEYVHNEAPGISVPAAVRRRMAGAADEPVEGLTIAREILDALPEFAAGVHVIPAYQKEDRVLALVRELELTRWQEAGPAAAE